MKVLKSKRKDDTYLLEIEESVENVRIAIDAAFQKLTKQVKIPGFRKGKAPKNIVEKHYDKNQVVHDALIDVVNSSYVAAIKELDLKVVDYPKNVDMKEYKAEQPFVFSCDVDVKPEVKLGKYKGLKAKKDAVKVDDNAIQEQIDRTRENYATFESADRAAQDKDVVRFSMEAKIGDEVVASMTKENAGALIGNKIYGEDFDKEILGLKKEDEKSFTVTYLEEYANKDVAGKTVDFKIKMEDVQERVLPELTDEFVEKSTSYKTVEEMKTTLKENMTKQAAQDAEEKVKMELIEQIIEKSKMNTHPSMIEREVDFSLKEFENQILRSGINKEQYLKMINKDDAALREDFKPNAEKRIQQELVLDAISEKESITVSDEDIKEDIKKWNMPEVQTEEQIDAYMKKIDLANVRAYLSNKKTIDFIIENAKIS
jgi:trigger factor